MSRRPKEEAPKKRGPKPLLGDRNVDRVITMRHASDRLALFEQLCAEHGTTMSDAVRRMIEHAIVTRRLP